LIINKRITRISLRFEEAVFNIKSQLSFSDIFIVSPNGKDFISSNDEINKLDDITSGKIIEAANRKGLQIQIFTSVLLIKNII